MSDELKACPICGSTAVFMRDGHIWKYIECMECDYKSKAVEGDVDVAVQEYNYRPVEDALRTENEILGAENKQLLEGLNGLGRKATRFENDREYNAGLVNERNDRIKELEAERNTAYKALDDRILAYDTLTARLALSEAVCKAMDGGDHWDNILSLVATWRAGKAAAK